MLEHTPSNLSRCSNVLPNLVQAWGLKMCTEAAVSLDTCTTGPQMRMFLAAWFVYMCMPVCQNRWRPSFIWYCDQIFYMIWYDDTGPIMGWACVKNVMTEQAEGSTVIWHLTGGGWGRRCTWEKGEERTGIGLREMRGDEEKERQEEWWS